MNDGAVSDILFANVLAGLEGPVGVPGIVEHALDCLYIFEDNIGEDAGSLKGAAHKDGLANDAVVEDYKAIEFAVVEVRGEV